MAKNAFYNQAAKATKGKGKNIRSAYEGDRMAELNRLMNEYLEKGGDS